MGKFQNFGINDVNNIHHYVATVNVRISWWYFPGRLEGSQRTYEQVEPLTLGYSTSQPGNKGSKKMFKNLYLCEQSKCSIMFWELKRIVQCTA